MNGFWEVSRVGGGGTIWAATRTQQQATSSKLQANLRLLVLFSANLLPLRSICGWMKAISWNLRIKNFPFRLAWKNLPAERRYEG